MLAVGTSLALVQQSLVTSAKKEFAAGCKNPVERFDEKMTRYADWDSWDEIDSDDNVTYFNNVGRLWTEANSYITTLSKLAERTDIYDGSQKTLGVISEYSPKLVALQRVKAKHIKMQESNPHRSEAMAWHYMLYNSSNGLMYDESWWDFMERKGLSIEADYQAWEMKKWPRNSTQDKQLSESQTDVQVLIEELNTLCLNAKK